MVKIEIRDDLFIEVPHGLEHIYRDFEVSTTEVVAETLTAGDVFLDVGANFGFFTVLAASLVGPRGRVYAVEASPEVLPRLAGNVGSWPNVHIIASAAGDRRGETEFHTTEDFVNSGVAPSPFQAPARKVRVPIDTLDNLLARAEGFEGRVDFVKCDVQGDEMAVLSGLRETIRTNPQLKLVVEWAPAWMKSAGYSATGFPDFLREMGFDQMVVVDDYLKTRMSVEEMEEEFRRDQTGKRFCNLLAWRSPA
jgi:methyltransferase, FkbM family